MEGYLGLAALIPMQIDGKVQGTMLPNTFAVCRFIYKRLSWRHFPFGLNVKDTTREDYFDGNFVVYQPYMPKSYTRDAIVWFDYALHASPDVSMLLWMHALTHLLQGRTLVKERNWTHQGLLNALNTDEELLFSVERTAWNSTLDLWNFMVHNKLFLSSAIRPAVDFLVIESVLKAFEAHDLNPTAFEEFIRVHIHRVPMASVRP